jgi:hypothetical protein
MLRGKPIEKKKKEARDVPRETGTGLAIASFLCEATS